MDVLNDNWYAVEGFNRLQASTFGKHSSIPSLHKNCLSIPKNILKNTHTHTNIPKETRCRDLPSHPRSHVVRTRSLGGLRPGVLRRAGLVAAGGGGGESCNRWSGQGGRCAGVGWSGRSCFGSWKRPQGLRHGQVNLGSLSKLYK